MATTNVTCSKYAVDYVGFAHSHSWIFGLVFSDSDSHTTCLLPGNFPGKAWFPPISISQIPVCKDSTFFIFNFLEKNKTKYVL